MLLGTWNLENLHRPGGPFGPGDEAAYESKLAALAAMITQLDPVLLGVQEVGDPGALEDLAGTLDDNWHLALSEHPDSRGIRVGSLSRTELTVGPRRRSARCRHGGVPGETAPGAGARRGAGGR